MSVQLVVRDHPVAPSPPPVRVFPLAEGEMLTVGRSPGAHITLPVSTPTQVARRQCDIRVHNGVIQIIDYGGSPSALHFAGRVLLNGRLLGKNFVWHDLRVGDKISVGESELELSRATEA